MRGNFRIWDNKDKRYDYGDFFITTDGELLKDVGSYSVEVWRCEYNEPGRYIAEFYTGIKDVNGDEICEGDIIECSGGIYKGTGKFDSIIRIDDIRRIGNGFRYAEKVEIISNIHKNPELLK